MAKKQHLFSVTEDLSEFLNEEYMVGKFQTAFDKTGATSALRSIVNVVTFKKASVLVVNVFFLEVDLGCNNARGSSCSIKSASMAALFLGFNNDAY